MLTIEKMLPAHWACYLINGDGSGLEDSDIAACDEWLDAHKLGASTIDVSEEHPEFHWRHDADEFCLACDCVLFTFYVQE